MNIIVDIGNTRTKLAYFERNIVQDIQVINHNIDNWSSLLSKHSEAHWIVSSVKNIDKSIFKDSSVLFFNKETALPIINQYKSEGLGMDRLASVVGAYDLFPNRDCLIIDLGSAITVDFLGRDGIFYGGNISVGLNFRFKALHNFTDRLPLVDSKGDVKLTSDTTELAIRSGVVKSIVYELEGYIQEYTIKYPDIKIILTGGDANFFVKQLKKRIFADENLVLKGLNRILNHNVDKK